MRLIQSFSNEEIEDIAYETNYLLINGWARLKLKEIYSHEGYINLTHSYYDTLLLRGDCQNVWFKDGFKYDLVNCNNDVVSCIYFKLHDAYYQQLKSNK